MDELNALTTHVLEYDRYLKDCDPDGATLKVSGQGQCRLHLTPISHPYPTGPRSRGVGRRIDKGHTGYISPYLTPVSPPSHPYLIPTSPLSTSI